MKTQALQLQYPAERLRAHLVESIRLKDLFGLLANHVRTSHFQLIVFFKQKRVLEIFADGFGAQGFIQVSYAEFGQREDEVFLGRIQQRKDRLWRNIHLLKIQVPKTKLKGKAVI